MYRNPARPQPLGHGVHEGAVTRHATSENNAPPTEGGYGTRGLLDERLDHGILEPAGDIRTFQLDIRGSAHRVQHGRLDTAE